MPNFTSLKKGCLCGKRIYLLSWVIILPLVPVLRSARRSTSYDYIRPKRRRVKRKEKGKKIAKLSSGDHMKETSSIGKR
ncbi:hypothetical protein TNCT_84281 [Trichonephila clavata]|uniref:Uncharacterized protein n=1 Tax=Trichonephila clavata TaxID=2740835 RepID=A0A8X6L6N0_TRICU|nr:hypothetical protein TNCT_84281 [Trichonephila clavata]